MSGRGSFWDAGLGVRATEFYHACLVPAVFRSWESSHRTKAKTEAYKGPCGTGGPLLAGGSGKAPRRDTATSVLERAPSGGRDRDRRLQAGRAGGAEVQDHHGRRVRTGTWRHGASLSVRRQGREGGKEKVESG